MTGPEHYREAERLIRAADMPYAVAEGALAEAQVHATLALAAATAAAGGVSARATLALATAMGVER